MQSHPHRVRAMLAAMLIAGALGLGASCGAQTGDEVVIDLGAIRFFVAAGVPFTVGQSPIPVFPGKRGVTQIGHVGLGRAFGFTAGRLTSLRDQGFDFMIPFQVNTDTEIIGAYQVTLTYDPTELTFSQVMGSNPGLATGAGVDLNAPPSMFMPQFSAAPATVVNEGINPATVVVSATAGAGTTQAGRVNLFNIEFRIANSLPTNTFAFIHTTVDILTNDVAADLIPTLPVLVISNMDAVPGETPAGVLVGEIN